MGAMLTEEQDEIMPSMQPRFAQSLHQGCECKSVVPKIQTTYLRQLSSGLLPTLCFPERGLLLVANS